MPQTTVQEEDAMADPQTDSTEAPRGPTPDLADLQHWTWVMGRAQQMMMEQGIGLFAASGAGQVAGATGSTNRLAQQVQDYWSENLAQGGGGGGGNESL